MDSDNKRPWSNLLHRLLIVKYSMGTVGVCWDTEATTEETQKRNHLASIGIRAV